MEDFVIELVNPLQPWEGKGKDPFENLTEIRLRPLYAGDVIAMGEEGNFFSQVMIVASRVSKVPRSALERLSLDDYSKVHGTVAGQLGKFLRTSDKLSASLPGSLDGVEVTL